MFRSTLCRTTRSVGSPLSSRAITALRSNGSLLRQYSASAAAVAKAVESDEGLSIETHTDVQAANKEQTDIRTNSIISSNVTADAISSGTTALNHAYRENTGFGTRPIYMDMQATTPTDPRVLDTMLKFYTGLYGNPHSNTHSYGWETNKAVEAAREYVADVIHEIGRAHV